jgi:Domain of unknown function (DUF6438)
MFYSKIFSFFFVCLLLACANNIAQIGNSNQTPQTEKTELSLTLKRSSCYGRCPVYELSIQPSGKVLFEGKRFTKTKGKAESNLSEDKLKQLVSEIDKADFFALKDSYTESSGNCPSAVTDHPTVTLFIKLRGKQKTITHYLGCWDLEKQENGNLSKDKIEVRNYPYNRIFPQQLYNLENKIDEIIEIKRWIGEEK